MIGGVLAAAMLLCGAVQARDCGDDHEGVTTRALLGALDGVDVECLVYAIHTASTLEQGEHAYRLLLVDAMASRERRRWRRLKRERSSWRVTYLERESWEDHRSRQDISAIDCSDMDIYLQNLRACHVRKKAREIAEASGPPVERSGIASGVDVETCSSYDGIAKLAAVGGLTEAQIRCLEAQLELALRSGSETSALTFLLQDAASKGDQAVEALAERVLGMLDCSDPNVYVEHEPTCDRVRRDLLGTGDDAP